MSAIVSSSAHGHSSNMPATSGWLLLAGLLTGMLLLGQWLGPVSTAAPVASQAPAPAAAPAPQPRPAPAAPTVALERSSRPFALPKPGLTTTRF